MLLNKYVDIYSETWPIFTFAFLFSNGSVKVDSELLVSNSSNATAQDFKQTLIRSNGTSNDEGFIFGKIAARGEYRLASWERKDKCQNGPQKVDKHLDLATSNYKRSWIHETSGAKTI